MNENIDRLTRIETLRNAWQASWCGICLKELEPENEFGHRCTAPAAISKEHALRLADFRLYQGWTIDREVNGEIVRVLPYHIDRRNGKVSAKGWEKGHYGEDHDFVVSKDEALKVRSREGAALFRGLTDAEINALDVAKLLEGTPNRVSVTVRACRGNIRVHLHVSGNGVYDDSLSIGWDTRRTSSGRISTRALCPMMHRNILTRGQRKGSKKLTVAQFRQEVNFLAERAEKRKS